MNNLMDPLISIEHFGAIDNVPGPKYHRGVSTFHYIFEDSAPYRSMDSEGNNLVIAPGSLLWNWTGNGLIHLESPVRDGAKVEGIQMVLKPSKRTRSQAIRTLYVPQSGIPETNKDGVRVQVICEPVGARSALDEIPDDVLLVHIGMQPGKVHSYRLPPNWSGTILAIEGRFDVMTNYETLELDQGQIVAMSYSDFEEPIEIFSIAPCRLIMASGMPQGESLVGQGANIGKSHSRVQRSLAPMNGSLYRDGQGIPDKGAPIG